MLRKLFLLVLALVGAMVLLALIVKELVLTSIGTDRSCVRREEIGGMVRSYLLEHPETVVDAMKSLKSKIETEHSQSVKAFISSKAAEIADGQPTIGQGPARIFELFDYKCPFCKKSSDTLSELASKRQDIQVVLVNVPILGPESQRAARAAFSVWLLSPKDFAQFHEWLFTQSSWTQLELERKVASMGLDQRLFREKMMSQAVTEKINANLKIAGDMDLRGVPMVVFESEIVPGDTGVADWMQKLDRVNAPQQVTQSTN